MNEELRLNDSWIVIRGKSKSLWRAVFESLEGQGDTDVG